MKITNKKVKELGLVERILALESENETMQRTIISMQEDFDYRNPYRLKDMHESEGFRMFVHEQLAHLKMELNELKEKYAKQQKSRKVPTKKTK